MVGKERAVPTPVFLKCLQLKMTPQPDWPMWGDALVSSPALREVGMRTGFKSSKHFKITFILFIWMHMRRLENNFQKSVLLSFSRVRPCQVTRLGGICLYPQPSL